MIETVLLASTLSLIQPGELGEAPDRVITPHRVELTQDARVFAFFAALNGLGYSYETKREGPPLRAPVFHAIRTRAKTKLRDVASAGKLDNIRAFFDKNPKEIGDYLKTILSYDPALKSPERGANPADLKDLKGIVPHLLSLAEDPAIGELGEALASEHRTLVVELSQHIAKTFDVASGLLKVQLAAPKDLTVVVNALDAQGSVRTVRAANRTWVLVGADPTKAEEAILQAAIQPLALSWAQEGYAKAPKLKKHWDTLKVSRRVASFGNGERYLAENLAEVLSYKVMAKAAGKKGVASEEEFIDSGAKRGLRWTRALLRSLDGLGQGKTETVVQQAIAAANP